jgi:hypothetical protein
MHYTNDIHSALELARMRSTELRAQAERHRTARQLRLRRTREKVDGRRRFWPALRQA